MPASGIPGLHDMHLGSHVCLFYRAPKEFLRVTSAFLKAGLAGHELCVWVLPPPINIPLAFDALLRHGLNGPMLQASQQLQIISAQEWYSSGHFDVDDSLNRLAFLPVLARKRGYARVRAAGGPGKFVSEASRQAFMRYERHVTPLLKTLPLIGLCCYASSECVATDMFDIMSAHHQTLIRTQAGWGSL
ncbi:MAG: MEDS domain-containing protein [Nitrospira sp.]